MTIVDGISPNFSFQIAASASLVGLCLGNPRKAPYTEEFLQKETNEQSLSELQSVGEASDAVVSSNAEGVEQHLVNDWDIDSSIAINDTDGMRKETDGEESLLSNLQQIDELEAKHLESEQK